MHQAIQETFDYRDRSSVVGCLDYTHSQQDMIEIKNRKHESVQKEQTSHSTTFKKTTHQS